MALELTSTPRPGPRPGSSREEIVECAIRMLSREGTDALTFRAVARELDITVGALSRYFKSLADLKDEIAARLLSELRPLSAASKHDAREQLVRLGMELLELNRVHPYLVKIQGPATAKVVAQHTHQCLEVLIGKGFTFERALAVYSMIGSLAHVWGVQSAEEGNPALQASITEAFSSEMGELLPQLEELLAANTRASLHRRWFLFCIDGALSAPTPASGPRRAAPSPKSVRTTH